MEEANNNEGLQSRREFFKSAAKTAIPVIGAFVLAGLPISQVAAMGCSSGSCYKGCADGCTGQCRTTCNVSCKSGCRDDCGATCKHKVNK